MKSSSLIKILLAVGLSISAGAGSIASAHDYDRNSRWKHSWQSPPVYQRDAVRQYANTTISIILASKSIFHHRITTGSGPAVTVGKPVHACPPTSLPICAQAAYLSVCAQNGPMLSTPMLKPVMEGHGGNRMPGVAGLQTGAIIRRALSEATNVETMIAGVIITGTMLSTKVHGEINFRPRWRQC